MPDRRRRLHRARPLLREQRRARGSLEFELPEAKVRVDDESGVPIDVEATRAAPRPDAPRAGGWNGRKERSGG